MALPRWLLAALLVWTIGPGVLADPPADDVRAIMERAFDLHAHGDAPGFLEQMQAAYALAPDDPAVVYNLACAHALLAHADEAVALLGRLADEGRPVDPRDDRDFDPIRSSRAFRSVLSRIDAAIARAAAGKEAPATAGKPAAPTAGKQAPATARKETPAAAPATARKETPPTTPTARAAPPASPAAPVASVVDEKARRPADDGNPAPTATEPVSSAPPASAPVPRMTPTPTPTPARTPAPPVPVATVTAPARAATDAPAAPVPSTATPSGTGSAGVRVPADAPVALAPGATIVEKPRPPAPPPEHRSQRLFSLPDPGLVPRGMAYDGAGMKYYTTSFHRRKIVVTDREGQTRDFIREGQDGFMGGTGIALDRRRRVLWAACAGAPGVLGLAPEQAGTSALYGWNLEDGTLVARHVLDARLRPHRLEGLAIDDDGNVYAADARAGTIYVLRRGGSSLEPVSPFETWSEPRAIALDERHGRMFVADGNGIEFLDLATHVHWPLGRGGGAFLGDAAALFYYRRGLVAVQPGLQRVLRIDLDRRRERVLASKEIEAAHPLFGLPGGGALVDDDLYFIANTNVEAIGAGDRLRDADRLPVSVVLKLPLS